MLNEFVEGGFRLPGASANDLLNSQINRMKSIALELPFLLTFFGCSKKVSLTKAAAALDSFEKIHGGR
jgi:hypothetical protein